ncbi:MAG: DEAD/DEAH box helicase [Muribaculaceae bacterium]|nr:DEAD/DEAH box helicase [Muribaculaceae bacterium]
MYNKETYHLIQQIPHISGITTENLPQFLTKVYAKIVALKATANTEDFHIGISKEVKDLGIIANTLEILLISDTEMENKKSIAFVGASSRQLMDMINPDDEYNCLSLYNLPYIVSASLQFVISGHFADAQEMAKKINYKNTNSPYIRDVLWSLQDLLCNRIEEVARRRLVMPVYENYKENIVEDVMFYNISLAIQEIALYLLGEKKEHDASGIILKINKLSVYNVTGFNQPDIYTGVYILCCLLYEAMQNIIVHSVFKLPIPQNINEEEWFQKMKEFAYRKPLIWDNHLSAIQRGVLNSGNSAILTFPTGAGKSTIADLKIIATILSQKRVIYIVPTHALEYQVQKSMESIVRQVNRSLNLDGELSEVEFDTSADSRISVITPERCLTRLILNPDEFLNEVGLFVFDEFHLISGKIFDHRAPEAMSLLVELLYRRPTADFLLISAMVKNGKDIKEWIESTSGHTCLFLDSDWKPTSQLQGCIVYSKEDLDELNTIVKTYKETYKRPSKSLSNKLNIIPKCFFSLKTVWDSLDLKDYYFSSILKFPIKLNINNYFKITPNSNEVAAQLAFQFLLLRMKIIIFALSPKVVNSINNRLNQIRQDSEVEFPVASWTKYKSEIEAISLELGDWSYSYLSKCTIATQHHSLLLAKERQISEYEFKDPSSVGIMVATPTISQGINLPSDIVIISGSYRFQSESNSLEPIKAHDILNAVGRAGRAGFRSHGTAILIPSDVIGYNHGEIGKDWMELKDDIFSQGDKCLKIEDPLAEIFNSDGEIDNYPIVLKFQGNKKDIIEKLKRTFFVHQNKIKNIELNGIADNIISARMSGATEDIWCTDLSMKTSLKVSDVIRIYSLIPRKYIDMSESLAVMDMIDMVEEVIKADVEIIQFMLQPMLSEKDLRNILDIKDENFYSDNTVKIIVEIMRAYISGIPLCELEKMILKGQRESNYVEKGRKIALKLMPALSYLCGNITFIFMAKAQNVKERDIDFSPECLCFASCIKEGVNSSTMLKQKLLNNWMRVEAHINHKQL